MIQGADNEDACPGEEPGDGDEGPGRGAPVGIPEMDAAAEVDGKEHGIECEDAPSPGRF